jgi:hypothetical protein
MINISLYSTKTIIILNVKQYKLVVNSLQLIIDSKVCIITRKKTYKSRSENINS